MLTAVENNEFATGLKEKSSIDGGTRRNNLVEGEAGGGEKACSMSPTTKINSQSRNIRRYTIDETV